MTCSLNYWSQSQTLMRTLRARALSDITSGGSTVSSLLSSGVNGKTFTRMVHLGPIETARAAQEAIAIYNDAETEVASTYADFRNLNR
jgi:hypothetical protein